ncbi:hypothetical protein JEQ12_015207 [Ovis aries]|uniref:Uncharacterized protein n=1 Tax=Ovis aries TaxID=9940 RepID=A0A836ALI9_SHEEP|nr:hypothetical protein JEQ12_015207 [Ovis aries]
MSRSLSCDAPPQPPSAAAPHKPADPLVLGSGKLCLPSPACSRRMTARLAELTSALLLKPPGSGISKPLQPTLSSSQNIPPHSPAQELPEQKRYEASFAICLEHTAYQAPH